MGDYTSKLKTNLKIGQVATIEGPYGRFTFDKNTVNLKTDQQIWVGAGIGITPFLAALGERANENIKTPNVHLLYCINQTTEQINENPVQLTQKARVMLHIFDKSTGLLTSARIKNIVKDWQ